MLDVSTARRLTGRPITSVEPLSGGEVHRVYEARAGDGAAVVVKIYREELEWKLDKEAFLCELVGRRTRVPAPRFLHREPGIAVMTRLPGRPLRVVAPPEPELVELNRRRGELLRELHTVVFDCFGYIETGVTEPAPSNVEFMARRLEHKLPHAPPHLRDPLARHFAERKHAFASCTTPVLCHNDAHDANLLVEDGRITGLVDWENAVAADPLLDLARSHIFSDGASEATLQALVEGYGILRADWREAFELYVLDHLLELWVWFERIDRTEPLERIEAGIARRIGA